MCLDRIMHPSGAHSRRTRCSVGGSETLLGDQKRLGTAKEHTRNDYTTPSHHAATDVVHPLMPWGGAGCGTENPRTPGAWGFLYSIAAPPAAIC